MMVSGKVRWREGDGNRRVRVGAAERVVSPDK